MLSSVIVIVCHCHRVTHRTVLNVVQQGARTLEEVGRACGAGTGCGGCRKSIEGLLEKSCPRECASPGRSEELGLELQVA